MNSNEIERSLDNLFGGNSIKTLSRQRVEHELKRLSQEVETVTRDSVLMSLQSSQDVATLYDVSRQSINTRAARLRKKRGSFGWQVGTGVWVFMPEEVEELKPRDRAGRPVTFSKEHAEQNKEIQSYLAKRLLELSWPELRQQGIAGAYSQEARDTLELLRVEIIEKFDISKQRSHSQIAKASRLKSN